MVTVPGSGPASAISTVRGPIPVDAVGEVLAAETLLRAPEPVRGNAGTPASDAEFQRAPVTIGILGRLLMGAENTEERTIGEPEALDALARLCDAAGPGPADPGAPAGRLVVALAGRGSRTSGAALARLSAESGIAIVRGADGRGASGPDTSGPAARELRRPSGGPPSGAADEDPESVGLRILDELRAAAHPAGVVGAIPILSHGPGPEADALRIARIRAAAEAARAGGAALVLDLAPGAAGRSGPTRSVASTPDATDRALADALAAVDAAGLPRDRVVLVGVSACIAAETGIDPARFAALLAESSALCFDDLGRIPNVRTVVSDHDVALAILRAAELGESHRILLSTGIRHRHRLAAYGGNGLEFVIEQFLPYLGMLGADAPLLRAVGGANAARILARTAPEETR